jgi:hypothetical protein
VKQRVAEAERHNAQGQKDRSYPPNTSEVIICWSWYS